MLTTFPPRRTQNREHECFLQAIIKRSLPAVLIESHLQMIDLVLVVDQDTKDIRVSANLS